MMKKTLVAGIAGCMLAAVAHAAIVDVTGVGAEKFSVQVNVQNAMFDKCLRRNLEISGLFTVSGSGSIKVSGAPGAIRAEGRGKVVQCNAAFSDDKSARMAARKLSDDMCEAFGQQKGFARDRVLFISRGKQAGAGTSIPGELCTSYPDGFDVRQLTSDRQLAVFPRWSGEDSVLYIGYLNGAPKIWSLDMATGKRAVKWNFRGSPTGIAVSPDGSKVAAILSFQGNPELYVLQGDRYYRLTETPLASEGQPTWSPDGKKIAYVSNETRHPHIYVIDVATRQKRRLTSRGRENVDPDWGMDGRIAYITKRGGSQVAVMNPAEGDASARLVTEAANWEHPSWSRDSRHLSANRDGAIFLIDTLENGDKPMQMFRAAGNWISPCWSRR